METKNKCPNCGSTNVEKDELVVGDVEYPCLFCLDCNTPFRRPEDYAQ